MGTKLQKQIIKLANCDVLDYSYNTIESIERDIKRRLKRQEKSLDKLNVNDELYKFTSSIISKNVNDLKNTLEVIKELK